MAGALADVAFTSISIVHILVWAFVLLAWADPRTARINLALVIPLIYVVHALPFHVLESAKQRLHPGTWEQDKDDIQRALVLPDLVIKASQSMDGSFANPLSAQGMLLFGAITSAWRLLL